MDREIDGVVQNNDRDTAKGKKKKIRGETEIEKSGPWIDYSTYFDNILLNSS